MAVIHILLGFDNGLWGHLHVGHKWSERQRTGTKILEKIVKKEKCKIVNLYASKLAMLARRSGNGRDDCLCC